MTSAKWTLLNARSSLLGRLLYSSAVLLVYYQVLVVVVVVVTLFLLSEKCLVQRPIPINHLANSNRTSSSPQLEPRYSQALWEGK